MIDVQESFRARPHWEDMANQRIAEPVSRLVRLARSRGDQVIWVLHTEPGSGNAFDPEQGHVRLLEELEQPVPGEPVLRKTAHNAFTTTHLQQLLTRAGVRELVLCGIRTEQCVETTARVGSDLGYGIVFVTDATTTDRATGLPPEAVIERTEAVLRGRFARIGSVAELELELEAEAEAEAEGAAEAERAAEAGPGSGTEAAVAAHP